MILLFAILLILAILSTKLASRIGIPGLLVFLGLGMLFGSDGFNLIYFDDPEMAQLIAVTALVIILFEGGFNTKRENLQQVFGPAFSLATVGVVITAVTAGLLSHLLLNLDLAAAMLLGAIIASTDATAVFSMFRNKKIQSKTSATLEIESASNDPLAIILTVTFIDLIQGTLSSPVFFIGELIWQISVGLLLGTIIGKTGPYLFNKLRLETGFYYVQILGLCFLCFGLADELQANGFLAVFIAGYWTGNSEFIYKQGINRFLEGISTFCEVTLFLMLGLLVFPLDLIEFWKQGIIIALILIFVARPVAVFISTVFWKYNLKERLFLSWGGMKGAVPIVLATYPYVAGLDNGHYFFNVVFFVVLISALIQGTTIDSIAKKFGLLSGRRRIPPHSMELLSLEETNYELIEFTVKRKSHLINKKIEDLPLPAECLIIAIIRARDIITPRGDTTIKDRDLFYILINRNEKDELLDVLEP